MTEAEYQFKMTTFGEFLALGPRVWTNWEAAGLKSKCFLNFSSPTEEKKGAIAAVLIGRRDKPKAIGRFIVQGSEKYELMLSPQLMKDFDAAGREKILLHEMTHLGYIGHGPDFRRVCLEVGGVLYGAQVGGGTDVHLEARQPNGRYKRMKTFPDEKSAKAWFNEQEQAIKRGLMREALMQQVPGMTLKEAGAKLRWRMVYG